MLDLGLEYQHVTLRNKSQMTNNLLVPSPELPIFISGKVP